MISTVAARQGKGLENELLQFGWIVGRDPPVPASIEGVDLGKSFNHELLCHTGTGCFVRSGSVEHQCFIFGVFVGPGFHIF